MLKREQKRKRAGGVFGFDRVYKGGALGFFFFGFVILYRGGELLEGSW